MNSEYEAFGDGIRLIAGQDGIITCSIFIADFAGGLEAGVLLSQIIYWSDQTSDPDGWFCKSYDDWYNELRIKIRAATSIISRFENDGIIETIVRRDPTGTPKKHYRIMTDRFDEMIYEFYNNQGKK